MARKLFCVLFCETKAFAQALDVHTDVMLVEKPDLTSLSFLPMHSQAGLSCASVFTWPYKAMM